MGKFRLLIYCNSLRSNFFFRFYETRPRGARCFRPQVECRYFLSQKRSNSGLKYKWNPREKFFTAFLWTFLWFFHGILQTWSVFLYALLLYSGLFFFSVYFFICVLIFLYMADRRRLFLAHFSRFFPNLQIPKKKKFSKRKRHLY